MARYKLTANPDVVRDTESGADVPVSGNWQSDAYQAWLDAGNTPDPLPAPTFADYVAQFTPGLQQWMESVAGTNGYDSVVSCTSYLGSGINQYARDARAMIDWRDALWKWAQGWQLDMNGALPNPIPTLAEVIALAPQPETYGWLVHDKTQPISAVLPDGPQNS